MYITAKSGAEFRVYVLSAFGVTVTEETRFIVMESRSTVQVIALMMLIASLLFCRSTATFDHTCETRDFQPESPRRGICGSRLGRTVDALCRVYGRRFLNLSSATSGN